MKHQTEDREFIKLLTVIECGCLSLYWNLPVSCCITVLFSYCDSFCSVTYGGRQLLPAGLVISFSLLLIGFQPSNLYYVTVHVEWAAVIYWAGKVSKIETNILQSDWKDQSTPVSLLENIRCSHFIWSIASLKGLFTWCFYPMLTCTLGKLPTYALNVSTGFC